eukprot:m.35978 g.35978  ORF g.35978 m.35978 type:complete len:66 (+) comp11215_c0_seq1:941-1138(+)
MHQDATRPQKCEDISMITFHQLSVFPAEPFPSSLPFLLLPPASLAGLPCCTTTGVHLVDDPSCLG